MIMEDEKFRHLQEYVVCRFWKKMDAAHTVVRFVTSWATTMEDGPVKIYAQNCLQAPAE